VDLLESLVVAHLLSFLVWMVQRCHEAQIHLESLVVALLLQDHLESPAVAHFRAFLV